MCNIRTASVRNWSKNLENPKHELVLNLVESLVSTSLNSWLYDQFYVVCM